jgi:hypothetical protein
MDNMDNQSAFDEECLESECERVDFKSSFDPDSTAEWLEIIKDMVALANSGGGCICFGIGDGGQYLGVDPKVLAIDPADVTNKVYKYTDQQFHGFSIRQIQRHEQAVAALFVEPASIPIVFSRVGSYGVEGGKQKTAFSAGTVYFRHGAKSEPGNSDDLRRFVDRRLEEIRRSWLDGITKVVEAPAGSKVQIVSMEDTPSAPSVRLVNDPSAPEFYRAPIDLTHPFRQKEVVEAVNGALNGSKSIKAFHIQCIRQAHGVDANPTLCYKQKFASARYSQAFVDWILVQHSAQPDFFEAAKTKVDELKRNGKE